MILSPCGSQRSKSAFKHLSPLSHPVGPAWGFRNRACGSRHSVTEHKSEYCHCLYLSTTPQGDALTCEETWGTGTSKSPGLQSLLAGRRQTPHVVSVWSSSQRFTHLNPWSQEAVLCGKGEEMKHQWRKWSLGTGLEISHVYTRVHVGIRVCLST